MIRVRRLAIAAAGLVVGAALMYGVAAMAVGGGSRRRTDVVKPTIGHQLYDADEHGAIVLDYEQHRFVGLDAAGRIVWVDEAAAKTQATVRCLAQCPDAVIYGSGEGMNRPEVADPPLRWHIGRGSVTDAERPDGKRQVLWAASERDAILFRSSRDGRRRLELRANGAPVMTQDVDGDLLFGYVNDTGRRALVIVSQRGSQPDALALWFERGEDGWRSVGTPVTTSSSTACLSPDGDRAILPEQQAQLVVFAAHTKTAVGTLHAVGACRFVDGDMVVGSLESTSDSASSVFERIRDGQVRWRRTVSALGELSAGQGSIAVFGAGQVQVFDADGNVVFRRAGIEGARLVSDGRLVVLGADGAVTRVEPGATT